MKPEDLTSGIDLLADVLIPSSSTWPAPSTLSLGADLVERLRERERAVLVVALEVVGPMQEFASSPKTEQIRRLVALEADEPAVFDLMRRCIYYGFYAQPTVIRILRQQGYDLNESPQPKGYRMEPFTPEIVDNVDRSRTVWIPADQVGQTLKTAS